MSADVENSIFYDCHCHILPGIDDGSRSMEETKLLLQQEYDEGIRVIIATPHFRPSRRTVSDDQIHKALQQTRRLAAQISSDLKIYLWNEAYWEGGLIYHLKQGNCKTVGEGCVLIEDEPGCSEDTIHRMIELLTANSFIPVLAHIERYPVIRKKPGMIDELKNAGAWIQVNTDSITGRNGLLTAMFCRKLLKNQKIDLLGTDCHRVDYRPPEFRKCIEYIRKNTSRNYFNRLMKENPGKLLKEEMYYAADATTKMG